MWPLITIITTKGIRMFTEPFMQRAFLAALFLAPLCGLLGVFVTARKMAFFSDTIAHGALAGIALGLLAGFSDLTIPMILFSFGVGGAVLWLKQNTELLNDTIMALLLSGSVALGILVLSVLKGHRREINSYLFGDILAVETMDVWLAAGLFAAGCIILFSKLNAFTLITAHEDMAHVAGIPVRSLNLLFIMVLTVTVAVSIRLLGIILVTSLLVIPAASARNVSRNLRQQLIGSFSIGIIGGLGGILLSYELNVPCGAAIVLICIGCFAASMVLGRFQFAPWPHGVSK
jgi:ABC-type Mn2+/Zn2+ transport system permease subunit